MACSFQTELGPEPAFRTQDLRGTRGGEEAAPGDPVCGVGLKTDALAAATKLWVGFKTDLSLVETTQLIFERGTQTNR